MANRRMLALTVIDTDLFLEMPVSARCLYYDLSMRGDDDGFVNPKKVIRLTNASEDDLKVLIAKKYVIPFESGVIVVRHWKIHNYIRKDTYSETIYKDEKALLDEDSNEAYTLRQLPVDGTSTQVRLGKVRLGKVRLERDVDSGGVLEKWEQELQDIVSYFNEVFESNIKSTRGFERNFKEWRKVHNIEKIKRAIEIARTDKFWGDKMTLAILFRTKNPNGEAVDRIEELNNKNQQPRGNIAIL